MYNKLLRRGCVFQAVHEILFKACVIIIIIIIIIIIKFYFAVCVSTWHHIMVWDADTVALQNTYKSVYAFTPSWTCASGNVLWPGQRLSDTVPMPFSNSQTPNGGHLGRNPYWNPPEPFLFYIHFTLYLTFQKSATRTLISFAWSIHLFCDNLFLFRYF